MNEDGISKLRLEPEMSWIELTLEKSKWSIHLNWKDGKLFFNREWFKFSEIVDIKEGDISVIISTAHFQKFRVAMHHLNREGICLC